MRYCSYDVNKERHNASENMVANVIALIFAPIRLFGEMSKKIIFLGDYARHCLLYCIFGETAFLLTNGVYQIVIEKRINFYKEGVSLLSMFIAVMISVGLYFLFTKFSIDVDLDNLDIDEKEKAISQIEKEHSESSKVFVDDEGTIINDIENYDGSYKEKEKESTNLSEGTVVEDVENGDIDIEDITTDEIFASTDKEHIDPVYRHSDEESYNAKLNELMSRFAGRNDPKKDIEEKKFIVERINVKSFCEKTGLEQNDFDSKVNLSDEEEDKFVDKVQDSVINSNVDDGINLNNLIKEDFLGGKL